MTNFKPGDLVVNNNMFFVIESITYEHNDLLDRDFPEEIHAIKVDVATATKTIGIRKLKPEDCVLATDYMRPMQRVMSTFS